MKATEILKEEHRLIEHVLASLNTAALRLKAGEPVTAAAFILAADFIRDFADGYHHKKEEGILFPALRAAGLPSEGGPVAVMLAEHERGRELTTAMRTAAEQFSSGVAGASHALVENALDYVDLLHGHIAKENQILFAMADQLIKDDAEAEVSAAFQRAATEQADHARFLALAEAIREAATRAPE